jgi:hypothetical protein
MRWMKESVGAPTGSYGDASTNQQTVLATSLTPTQSPLPHLSPFKPASTACTATTPTTIPTANMQAAAQQANMTSAVHLCLCPTIAGFSSLQLGYC